MTMNRRSRTCRDCGAPIRFVRLITTGKLLPIDPDPHPSGNVAAWPAHGRLEGYVITKDRPASSRATLCTCPTPPAAPNAATPYPRNGPSRCRSTSSTTPTTSSRP